jgi:hypothetical protein
MLFDKHTLENVEDVCEVLCDIPSNTPLSSLHPALRPIHEKLNEMIGLEYAVRVVLGEVTHTGICTILYEAGILLCVAGFVQFHRQRNTLPAFLANFDKLTAVKLLCFDMRLRQFMKAASRKFEYVPVELTLDALPVDASVMWNGAHGKSRVLEAVLKIDFGEKVGPEVDDHLNDHVNFVLLLFKMNIGRPTIQITQIKGMKATLPLCCGVCFEPASPDASCGHGTCKYVTCVSCRKSIAVCPFCRVTW